MIHDLDRAPDVRRLVCVLLISITSCHDDDDRSRPEPSEPESLLLRHGFKVGRELRYDSRTMERSSHEVTIDLRSRWKVTKIGPGGAAELLVTIERYSQRVFPPTEKISPDVTAQNKGLAGARFKIVVSPDGREIEHLSNEGVPQISDFSVEALRSTLGSHILRLPEKEIRVGQRWTVNTNPPDDAGPGGVKSTSQWRVLSSRPSLDHRLVELVCLSTMEPGVMRLKGSRVTNMTEFHYSYLWDETVGVLQGLTSSGKTVTVVEPEGDAGGEAASQTTIFEARLTLLNRAF